MVSHFKLSAQRTDERCRRPGHRCKRGNKSHRLQLILELRFRQSLARPVGCTRILVLRQQLCFGDPVQRLPMEIVQRELVTESPQKHACTQHHQKNGEPKRNKVRFWSFDHYLLRQAAPAGLRDPISLQGI
jgi:hypothetical protein